MSGRETGASGVAGGGFVLVAVGGTGVGSVLQAKADRSTIAVAAGTSRRLIFNSDLLPAWWFSYNWVGHCSHL